MGNIRACVVWALMLALGAGCGGVVDEVSAGGDCGSEGSGAIGNTAPGASSADPPSASTPKSPSADNGMGDAAHASANAPPKAGLVGWWSFDTPGPDVVDMSGNGNNGTAQGEVVQVPGRVGMAYALDGGCIGVPDSPSLAMVGGNEVTMMAWIDAASACTSDNCEFLNKENTYEMAEGAGTITGNEQPWESIPGAFGEAIMRGDGQWFWNEQTPNVIATGTWLHVAVTWDGATVTRYLDGAVLADPSNPRALDSSSTFASSGWGLGIGCRAVAADGNVTGRYPAVVAPFHGILDEAAVYNRALTPAEIAAYYAATR